MNEISVQTAGGMLLSGSNRSTRRKICTSDTVSTINPTFEIRRVVVNIEKTHSRTANKSDPPALGLGKGLTRKINVLRNVTQGLGH